MTHGAFALVHRPEGEPETMLLRVEGALVERFRPDGAGQLEVVRGLSQDLVRIERLGQVEGAATALARLEIGRSAADNQRLTMIDLKLKLWETLLQQGQALKKQLADDEVGGLRYLGGLGGMVEEALDAGKLTDVQTTLAGADQIVKITAEISVPGGGATRLSKFVGLCRAWLRYLKAERNQILSGERERHSCEADLAELPDERTIRRIDRYRSTIERSVLRRIEILKGLKELGCPVAPDE